MTNHQFILTVAANLLDGFPTLTIGKFMILYC
jgi:hypothetical protein